MLDLVSNCLFQNGKSTREHFRHILLYHLRAGRKQSCTTRSCKIKLFHVCGEEAFKLQQQQNWPAEFYCWREYEIVLGYEICFSSEEIKTLLNVELRSVAWKMIEQNGKLLLLENEKVRHWFGHENTQLLFSLKYIDDPKWTIWLFKTMTKHGKSHKQLHRKFPRQSSFFKITVSVVIIIWQKETRSSRLKKGKKKEEKKEKKEKKTAKE